MSARIHIKIKSDGDVEIWVEGVKGKRCLDITKFLEEGLGEVKSKEFTTDYYDVESIDLTEENKMKES